MNEKKNTHKELGGWPFGYGVEFSGQTRVLICIRDVPELNIWGGREAP